MNETLAALSNALIPFLLWPVATLAFGERPEARAAVVWLISLSFLAGQVFAVPERLLRLLFFAFSLSMLALYYRFDWAIEYRFSTLFMILALPLVSGLFNQSSLYPGIEKKFSLLSYSRLNLLSGLAAGLFALVVNFFGEKILALSSGIIFLGFLARPHFSKSAPSSSWTLADLNQTGALLGLASSVWVASYFEIMEALFRPTGFEFPIYLIVSFLCLAVSGVWSKLTLGWNSFVAFLSLSILLLGTLISSTSGTLSGAFFEVIRGSMTLGILPSWIGAVIFLIPYLAFSGSIPLLEAEGSQGNKLISVSVGNLVGWTIFLLLSALNTPLGWKLALSLSFVLLALRGRVSSKLSVVLLLILPSIPLLYSDLKLVTYSAAVFATSWKQKIVSDLVLETPIYRTGSSLISVFQAENRRRMLAQGGYLAQFGSLKEIHQVLVAQTYGPRNPERILVLGGGGMQALTAAADLAPRAEIDVVEISSAYENKSFLDDIYNLHGFRTDESHLNRIHWIRADAFIQIHSSVKKYDWIIWNLSHPTYGPALKLYSRETLSRLSTLLTSQGVLVSYLDAGFFSDCKWTDIWSDAFPNGQWSPGLSYNQIFISHPFGKASPAMDSGSWGCPRRGSRAATGLGEPRGGFVVSPEEFVRRMIPLFRASLMDWNSKLKAGSGLPLELRLVRKRNELSSEPVVISSDEAKLLGPRLTGLINQVTKTWK